MRMFFRIVGVIALVAGLVFVGQGSGYFPWPRTSFMISDVHWVYYGAAIAVAGLLAIVLTRPRG